MAEQHEKPAPRKLLVISDDEDKDMQINLPSELFRTKIIEPDVIDRQFLEKGWDGVVIMVDSVSKRSLIVSELREINGDTPLWVHIGESLLKVPNLSTLHYASSITDSVAAYFEIGERKPGGVKT